jgi:L-malate glycosyltransferase
VTTDAGGTKELVLDGVTGFMLPIGDVDGLAKATLKLVNDRHLRATMGEAARKHIEANFSFTGRLHRIESLYERVVAQHFRSLNTLGTAPHHVWNSR